MSATPQIQEATRSGDSHTTATDFPRTPSPGAAETTNHPDGKSAQALLGLGQPALLAPQPTPAKRAASSPVTRTRHHPYASYAGLDAEEDDGSPGPQRRKASRKASTKKSRRKAYGGDDDSGSDWQPGGAQEDSDYDDYQPSSTPKAAARSARQTSYPALPPVPAQYLPSASQEPQGMISVPQLPKKGKKSDEPKGPVRLTATGKPSHARKTPPDHIKRPRNAFILFRSHACVNGLIPTELGITDHRHVSRIVGNLWRGLPPEEKRIWELQAEAEKEEHRRRHPDYKYRPVYRREGVVRRRRKKGAEEKDIEEEERKCEVVARVLLEGGDITEERVQEELEAQRERDEIEGRVRGSQSRSPSRGQSATPAYQGYPPGLQQQYPQPDYSQHYAHPGQYDHLQAPPMPQQWVQSDQAQASGSAYMMRSHSAGPPYELQPQPALQHYEQLQQHQQHHPQPMYDQHLPPQLQLHHATSPSMFGHPATPRSFAMLQHPMYQQQQHGIPSPRTLAGMRDQQPPAPEMAQYAHHQDEQHQQQNGEDVKPDPNAALAEPPTSANRMPGSAGLNLPPEMQQQVTYEPENNVQYIYLDPEQAQDHALIESIRAQGFGVSFSSVPA